MQNCTHNSISYNSYYNNEHYGITPFHILLTRPFSVF